MGLQAKQTEGVGFDPVPEGTHHAVCCSVIDLGVQTPKNPAYRPSRRVMLSWELPEERYTNKEREDKPRTAHRDFPLSLGNPSKPTKFREFLEAWRGRKFTDEELAGFDLKNLLGVNCLITVTHKKGETVTFENVNAASALPKGMAKKGNELPHVFFSFDDIPADHPIIFPEGLPDWVRNKIMKSAEYVSRTSGNGHSAEAAHDDDDIPF